MYARDHAVIATPIGPVQVEGDRAVPGAIHIGGDTAPIRGSAIGQLCARNFPIVVPCHRILARGGKLGHYAGGDGPKTKSWLLGHERRFSGATRL